MGIICCKSNRRVTPSEGDDGQPSNQAPTLHRYGTFISNDAVVIWLDSDAYNTDIIYQNSLARLQQTFSTFNIMTTIKDAMKYLSTVKNSSVIMVISIDLFEEIWPRIKPMNQVDSIYILSPDGEKEELLEQGHQKVKGVFTRVESICSSMTRRTKIFRQEALIMSIIPSMKYTKKDLPHLNQLFIYWMMTKQIILDTKYENNAMKILTQFCRSEYLGNTDELKLIDEFEENYRKKGPIWWYTRDCFVSALLNRAIQTQDIEIIIRMGFFIKDLHQQLEKLQLEAQKHHYLPIIAYRTQTVSNEELKKITEIKGNLLTFSNFIYGDPDYDASLALARRKQPDGNGASILFRMKVESKHTSSPYALLGDASYSPERAKFILFSIHSVFRIIDIKQIERHVWEIDLTLTDVNDERIVSLTEILREETRDGPSWFKLGRLMTTLRHYDRARDIYFALLEAVPENDLLELAKIYNELGLVSDEIGDYTSALSFYQKAFEIRRKNLPPNHRSLSVSYNNMGEVQRQMGDYYSAFETQKKALNIKERSLRPNDPSFAVTYNNIALAKESLGDFNTALEFYEKALHVRKRILPADHLELATIYNNIGELYRLMGDFPTALKNLQKALAIRRKKFTEYDATLAIPYNNIGLIYRELGDYSKAIDYLQKSLTVKEKSFPPNHPSVALTHNNLGDIHHVLGKYSEALISYKTALEIQEKTYNKTHPELAITFTNMGVTHQAMGNTTEALEFYNKALEIRQKAFPLYHPLLGVSYNNIGHAYQLIGQYKTALEYYEKTLRIQQRSLQENHPAIGGTYNNLADVHRQLKNHNKALVYYKKSLDIKKKTLPAHHPTLIITYNNMGVLNQATQSYAAALECFRQTLTIQQKHLPADHPDMAAVFNNMAVTYQSMKEFQNALEYANKALTIQEKVLPSNHPDIATTHNTLATIHVNLSDFKKALEHEQKAVDIASETLRADHPYLLIYRNYLERIKIKVESMN